MPKGAEQGAGLRSHSWDEVVAWPWAARPVVVIRLHPIPLDFKALILSLSL